MGDNLIGAIYSFTDYLASTLEHEKGGRGSVTDRAVYFDILVGA